ncbi:MAG: cell shape determination protein CcmA [Acidobacteriales bacterium 59-55]|nr:polymer-forming cytoskeletal protein [Terriglobales bacterium]ODU55408.1 MAG: cell shape determination protein CcmA [Granulicella sp. SCN 62-9]OJV39926.1 MAG: cell shape determination protein CcmA [Acidobacteriales bacterium 59-55]
MNPAEGSTVIGKTVIIRGEISGKEDLYLDCDTEGTISLPENRLTLGPDARVVANLTVRDLVVFGTLTGNVQASGRVDLRQSASVTGDIVAGRLSIEESAMLKGRVELLRNGETASASAPRQASPASTTVSSEPLVLQPKA